MVVFGSRLFLFFMKNSSSSPTPHPLRPPGTNQQIRPLAATWKVRDVGIRSQRRRNFPAGLDLTDLDEAVTGLSDSLADDIGTLGFTLGTDNVGLALLLGPLDDEAGSLGVLLRNLLLLDGLGELLAEGHVGDGDVLKGNVELAGALHEVGPDAVGDGLTLGDELGGVELGDDRLEDFVTDGGEDTLIVICAEVLWSCELEYDLSET